MHVRVAVVGAPACARACVFVCVGSAGARRVAPSITKVVPSRPVAEFCVQKKWFSKFEILKMPSCNRKIVGNSNSIFLTFGNLFGTAFRWGFDYARFCGIELPSY